MLYLVYDLCSVTFAAMVAGVILALVKSSGGTPWI